MAVISRGIILCRSAHALMEDALGNAACVLSLAAARLEHLTDGRLTAKERELLTIIKQQSQRLGWLKESLHPCDVCTSCDLDPTRTRERSES